MLTIVAACCSAAWSWAVFGRRIMSASPSAVFAVAVVKPARTARAAFSASGVSDFAFIRRLRSSRSGRPAPTTV
ncbi:hypothetical protein [Streptomyces sp. NPDC051014]|uniref:hypothetical protein n=1 Tax=Streptomyces sp. NPDC051014 TaxID=3155751 RepID=UPI0033F81FDB